MAQYEIADKDALKALTGPNSGLTAATQAAILALINDSSASFVATEENGTATSDSSAEGLYASKGTNLNGATFDNVTTAVFDEGANGTANLTSDHNITAELVNPNALDVTTGDGNNDIAVDGGQASVTTGSGEDLFAFNGNVKGLFKSGLGDDDFQLDEAAQKNAEISVDAGDGFDVMTLFGASIKHSFSFSNGQFHMSSANITLNGVEVVATDLNQDGRITDSDHITVLAADNQDSLAARLYQIALGREAIDETRDSLAGIQFWMDQAEDDLYHFGRAFLNCDEFHAKYDKIDDNKQYVDILFANLYENAGNPKDGEAFKAELLSKLESGQLDRIDVAIALAENDDLVVKVLGNDGQQYVIDSDKVDFDA